jgi:hypothetical protein
MLLPDTQIEDEAVDFFLDENLTPEEQQTLMDVVDNDPAIAGILDKVVLRAIESTQEGAIDGAGTGTSDSIPARLSDGEFVFTAKAVEVIGVQNLEAMMARAEEQADLGDIRGIEVRSEVGLEGSDQRFLVKENARDSLSRVNNRINTLEANV